MEDVNVHFTNAKAKADALRAEFAAAPDHASKMAIVNRVSGELAQMTVDTQVKAADVHARIADLRAKAKAQKP